MAFECEAHKKRLVIVVVYLYLSVKCVSSSRNRKQLINLALTAGNALHKFRNVLNQCKGKLWKNANALKRKLNRVEKIQIQNFMSQRVNCIF